MESRVFLFLRGASSIHSPPVAVSCQGQVRCRGLLHGTHIQQTRHFCGSWSAMSLPCPSVLAWAYWRRGKLHVMLLALMVSGPHSHLVGLLIGDDVQPTPVRTARSLACRVKAGQLSGPRVFAGPGSTLLSWAGHRGRNRLFVLCMADRSWNPLLYGRKV